MSLDQLASAIGRLGVLARLVLTPAASAASLINHPSETRSTNIFLLLGHVLALR